MTQAIDSGGNVHDLTEEGRKKATDRIREAVVGRTILDFQELSLPEGLEPPEGFDGPMIFIRLDEERALVIHASALMILGADMNINAPDANMDTPLFTLTKAH